MDLKRLEAAYDKALSLEGRARAEYLDQLRHEDSALAKRVEAQIATTRVDDSFLKDLIAESAMTLAETSEDPWIGRQLGVYRIVERIAAGGMGVVFLAERADQQFEQQVAIKVTTSRLLSDEAIQRFMVERQVLASLQHPYIAQLLDGGTTEEGLPYFVMEYIAGLPIDAHCDQQALTVRQRLALFCKAAQAVDYAHRMLIVHRDIKPANILVTEDGTPKLLDFGIAKLLDPESAPVASEQTVVGRRMLTFEYASPEQLRAERVTTATDVYSLGVLLYRLLSGQSPYDLSDDSPANVESQILGTLPDKPSSRLTVATGVSPAASRQRSATAQQLRRQLSGDLDNIVLMALRKEPERRYRSAGAMVEDIDKYLKHQPVIARADSWHYRTGKFLRRNTLAVGLVAAAFLFVSTVAALTLQQNKRVSAERDVANGVAEFLIDTFEAARPEDNPGETVTAEQILDNSRDRIREELAAQPEIQARLMQVMGSAYVSLGLFDRSVGLYEEALTLGLQGHLTEPDLAVVATRLGDAHSTLGNNEQADEAFAMAQQIYDRLGQKDSPTYAQHLVLYGYHLHALGNWEEGLGKLLEAAEIGETFEIDPDAVYTDTLHNLGGLYLLENNLEDAQRYLTLALNTGHPNWGEGRKERAITSGLLSRVLYRSGRPNEALPHIEQTIEILERVYGRNHPYLAPAYSDYAFTLAALNHFDEAEAAARKGLSINEAKYGSEHYNVALSYSGLATIAAQRGRFEEALPLIEKSLELKLLSTDADHPRMAVTYRRLGEISRGTGDLERSLENLDRALTIGIRAWSGENQQLAEMFIERAKTHAEMGAIDKALDDSSRGLGIHRRVSAASSHTDALLSVAALLNRAGACQGAAEHLQQASDARAAGAPLTDDWLNAADGHLAACRK